MTRFDVVQFRQLVERRNGPCVSLFMPVHVVGQDRFQDGPRLKNLVRSAEQQLGQRGLRSVEARDLVAAIAALPDDELRWSRRGRGLAVFAAREFFRAYTLDSDLAEEVHVADRFRTRPLLPLLEGELAFHLLHVSQKDAVLYHAAGGRFERLAVSDMPKNLAEAIGEVPPGRGTQAHTSARAAGGRAATVFHGHGGRNDSLKPDLLDYFRKIDAAVGRQLNNRSEPLLLACVDYLEPMYRQVSSHPRLVDRALRGNIADLSEGELWSAAAELVRPVARQPARAAAERFRESLGHRATDDLSTVVAAAQQGRIDVLFFDPKAHVYGKLTPDGAGDFELTGSDADDDLVDVTAIAALQTGGQIVSMRDETVVSNAPLAALLRY